MSSPDPVGNRRSTWGEGPIWWSEALWYVDIEDGMLIRYDPKTDAETCWDMGQRIGFIRPCVSGKFLWGGDGGLFGFDPETGASTPIANPEADRPRNRFNDAGTSPDGQLFAGTIAMDKTPGAAALYRMGATCSPTPVLTGLTNSNGIAWSPDGTHCYHIDTPTRQVRQFRYVNGDLKHGTGILDTTPLVDASPDGMCIDRDGRLWIAFCHGGCVIGWDPTEQTPPIRLDLPCRETTACCFGGPDLRDLYVTTGKTKPENEPGGGRLFVFRTMDTPGLPLVPFQDKPA